MIATPYNAVRCLRCSDVIESTHRHDFKFCKCGNVAVDGGKDYARRCFMTDEWEELGTLPSIKPPNP